MFNNLKDHLYGNDHTQTAELNLDFESIMEEEVTTADLESEMAEVSTQVDAAVAAVATANEVEDAAAELAEKVEDMNPVEVGKAIGEIENKLETIAESVEEVVVDTEALVAGDLSAGIRQELEGITDTLKKAWEAIKNFFKSIWTKIKQTVLKLIVWFGGAGKKAKKIREELEKRTELKSNINAGELAKKIGNKLAASGAAGYDLDKIDFAKDVINYSSMTEVDKEVLGALKSGMFTSTANLGVAGSKIKVTRADGATVKFAHFDTDGYVGYFTATVKDSYVRTAAEGLAGTIAKGGKDMAVGLLKGAEGIADKVPGVRDTLFKEMVEIEKSLAGDIEAQKKKMASPDGFFKTMFTRLKEGKSASELSDQEVLKAMRAKSSFVSSCTRDVLFGMNGLVKDMVGIGVIVLGTYEKPKS